MTVADSKNSECISRNSCRSGYVFDVSTFES